MVLHISLFNINRNVDIKDTNNIRAAYISYTESERESLYLQTALHRTNRNDISRVAVTISRDLIIGEDLIMHMYSLPFVCIIILF